MDGKQWDSLNDYCSLTTAVRCWNVTARHIGVGKVPTRLVYFRIVLAPPAAFSACFVFAYPVSLMSQTRKCGVMTTQVNDFSVCLAFRLHQLIPANLTGWSCAVRVSIKSPKRKRGKAKCQCYVPAAVHIQDLDALLQVVNQSNTARLLQPWSHMTGSFIDSFVFECLNLLYLSLLLLHHILNIWQMNVSIITACFIVILLSW